MPSIRTRFVLNNPLKFLQQIVVGFRANQGLLLSGAIAYYTLLSIIPILALILVLLSQFKDPQGLLDALRDYLVLVTPGQTDAVIKQLSVFLQNWKVVGMLGLALLLFFSSFAFTALENAMSVIFFHRVAIKRRHFLVSAVIPYLYIFLLGIGMLIVSFVSGFLHSLNNRTLSFLGQQWSLGYMETSLIYLFGVCGEVLLLTSLYLVMPVGRLSTRHAPDRRHHRRPPVGADAAYPGLVFFKPVAGECHLWRLWHGDHHPHQPGGGLDYSLAGRTGDCRI